jgi:hypothetical protein
VPTHPQIEVIVETDSATFDAPSADLAPAAAHFSAPVQPTACPPSDVIHVYAFETFVDGAGI